jgi:3-phosphoinositide dependent protein kinase-1
MNKLSQILTQSFQFFRDLKPENLLLNHKMHLLVADFGSSKILPEHYIDTYDALQAEIERLQAEDSNESCSDSEQPNRSRRRRRKTSFVGTANYVSPEILKGFASHWATDLWSFACIIYQMLAGSPPFRGATEYLIFQKVIECEYSFPEEFDELAKDLITKLLVFEPKQRLGGSDDSESRYHSIRSHPFFEGIQWNNLHKQTPPDMNLPDNFHDEESGNDFSDDNFEADRGLGSESLKLFTEEQTYSCTYYFVT